MTPEEKAAAEKAAEESRSAEIAKTQAAARRAEIIEFAEIFKEGELARTMLLASESVTVDDVRVAIRAKQKPAAIETPTETAAETAARQGGVQLARTFPRVKLEAFKGPKCIRKRIPLRHASGSCASRDEDAIKYCRENGIALSRTQTGTDNTKGGFTVLPEFEQTIFELRLQYGVARNVTRRCSDGFGYKACHTPNRRLDGISGWSRWPRHVLDDDGRPVRARRSEVDGARESTRTS
jgi:hypothetical protein